jgi:hypothetical protein
MMEDLTLQFFNLISCFHNTAPLIELMNRLKITCQICYREICVVRLYDLYLKRIYLTLTFTLVLCRGHFIVVNDILIYILSG